MPIYMDRHDIPGQLTQEDVAHIHQQDLEIQDQYNCRAITYWYDGERNKAFCLYEAPDKKSILSMHAASHGQVPHYVIEVEGNILESFYGGIENLKKSHGERTPSRTIIAVKLNTESLNYAGFQKQTNSLKELNALMSDSIRQFTGDIIEQNIGSYLISLMSATNAMACATRIQTLFELSSLKTNELFSLKIGIHAGIPVTDKSKLFESTILFAERLSSFAKAKITVSSEVKTLYKSENHGEFIDDPLVNSLNPSEEEFLTIFMEYIEGNWKKSNLKVEDFGNQIGYSKSQLYRKIVSLTGKSTNLLLKDFRLTKSLDLLSKQKGNISQICFECGFNSPAYFSKCFLDKYGLLPSDYLKGIKHMSIKQ